MTSTNSYFKLIPSTLKRMRSNLWMTTLISLILIFVGPVISYFILKSVNNRYSDSQLIPHYYDHIFLPCFVGIYIVTFILAFSLALMISFYLHKKKQVDYFHALPARRSQLLNMKILDVSIIFVLVLFFIMVLQIFIFSIYVPFSGLLMKWAAIHYFQILLTFFLTFFITLVAGQLTGHTLAQGELSLLFLFGGSLLGFVLHGIFSFNFHTFIRETYLENMVIYWNPFGPLLTLVQAYDKNPHIALLTNESAPFDPSILGNPTFSTTAFIASGIVVILAIAATYILYTNRRLENAGRTFAYSRIAIPIKIYLLFVSSIIGGLFVTSMFEKDLWFFIIGLMLTGLISHILINIAFNRSVRDMRKGLLATIVILFLTLGFYLTTYFDIYGYDQKVPQADHVTSISIDAPGVDNHEFGNTVTIQNTGATAKNIPDVAAFVETLSKNNIKNDNIIRKEQTIHIQVHWYVNKREHSRVYEVRAQTFIDGFKKLYSSRSFRESMYQALFDPDFVKYVTYAEIMPTGNISPSSEYGFTIISSDREDQKKSLDTPKRQAFLQELIESLQKDVQNRSFDDLQKEALATIQFNRSGKDRTATFAQIYASDVNAIATVQKGIAEGILSANCLTQVKMDSVKSLAIYTSADGGYKQGDSKLLATVTDPKLIEDILHNRSCDATNGGIHAFFRGNAKYIILVNNLDSNTRYFIHGKIPEQIALPQS